MVRTPRDLLVGLLIGLPVLSLALNALAWLTYGLDLPFFDDWRGYAAGNIASLDPGYLFAHVNDTLAPVGFALDAIAQRYLNGNPLPYQFLSMTLVLGGLLYWQWKLLDRALDNRLQVAACFALTLLMLQPGSYWGRENLAYHQALPLLCLLPALWLSLHENMGGVRRGVLVLLLAVIGGFSYISGAIAMLVAGGMLMLIAVAGGRELRARVLAGAVAMTLGGMLTAAMQVYPLVFGGRLANRAYAPLALPDQPDFWLFLGGKVGRALMLPADSALPALAVIALVVACAIALVVVAARGVLAQRLPVRPEALLMCLILCPVTLAYLMVVAAGRTNLRAEDVDTWREVFAHGFTRFHFFWATILWPWLLAALIRLAADSASRRSAERALVLLPVALLPLVIAAGAMDHFSAHEKEVRYRLPTIACLMAQAQRGEGINCAEFNMPDFSPAFDYGRRTGASFVRHYPILPIPLGIDDPAPLFRLSRDRDRTTYHRLEALSEGSDRYRAGDDAQLSIRTGEVAPMANCSLLQLTAKLRSDTDAYAQVYFRRRNQPGFSEEASARAELPRSKRWQILRFELASASGFEDALRFDPTNSAQSIEIGEVEVRCRIAGAVDPEVAVSAIPLYRLGEGSGTISTTRISRVGAGVFRGDSDPSMILSVGRPKQMRACAKLGVEVVLRTEVEDFAQLFYLPRGERDFVEERSSRLPVAVSQHGRLMRFQVQSSSGFEDEIRFDPVSRPQRFGLNWLAVSCLKRIGGAAQE